jgi:hypothetical protein
MGYILLKIKFWPQQLTDLFWSWETLLKEDKIICLAQAASHSLQNN